jgi:TetR/AcrR family transcriptional repressor of nem operon
MKVSKEVVARHREKLLKASGRLLRERGFENVAVADVAAAAGLTHGAVYAQFPSKEALWREAVTRLLADSAGAGSRRERKAFIELYLSPRHVRGRATGCPYTALAADVPRASATIRDAFSRGLEQALDRSAGRPGGRDRAIASMALMVGAVVLARAAGKRGLRDEILAAARREILG